MPPVPMVGLGAAFVVEETEAGDDTVGMVGATEVTTLPNIGEMLTVGTAAAELTPRLPISVDPNGMAVRGLPPTVVGDIELGVDEAVTLLEPEPHIPDRPDVSNIPEVVDNPEVADIVEELESAGELDIPPSDVAAVAGVALAAVIPPPS